MNLSLESWRASIGYHPLHFWQLESTVAPVTSNCNTYVYKYAWQQSDRNGRDDLKSAINDAHARLREYLKFNVGVHWVTETVPFAQLKSANLTRYADIDPRGRRIPVKLPEGEILEIGIEQNVIIDDAAAVVLSDVDGDGYDETFTLTVDISAISDLSIDEIAVYFADSDRLDGAPISDDWLIDPVSVSISGNFATIIGKAWQIVKPILYEGFASQPIDGDVAGNYVAELEVYQRRTYKDGTTVDNSQAVLIWESAPYPCWANPCNTLSFETGETDPNAVAYAVARCGIRDPRTGYVTPGEAVWNENGTWSEVSWSGDRQPDKAIIRYKAGVPFDVLNSRQDGDFKKIVSRLAAAETMRPICACESANQELYRWQFDLSRSAGVNDEQYRISEEDLNNPFGTRAGMVYAWKQVKNLRLIRGHLA